jgi:hypothetical protein
MNVAPLESPLSPSPMMNGIMGLDNTLSLGLGNPGIGADAIARFVAPQTAQTSAETSQYEPMTQDLESSAAEMYNPMNSMMAQLMQMMQQLMSSLGLGTSSGSGYPGYGYPGYGSSSPGYGSGYPGYGSGNGCPPAGNCQPYGNEQYYNSATGASQGDPHLSFNGNTWDNMTSQPNLLQSNSFQGGYQISTQVTQPNANGVTHNQCATITMNGGNTTVSLNNQGEPLINEYGQSVPISQGQTVQLGNGQSVTCNQNGSLTVLAQNGQGGQITTTLTQAENGVNVNVNAQNVDLGGSLVNGNNGTQPPPYTPPTQPIRTSPPGYGQTEPIRTL